jgi:threonine/homoserine/homoserine lactone efflux protein
MYRPCVPDLHTIGVFALASVGLVALPGPAIVYIVTRGIVHGRRGGLVSMLGVECGNVLQTLAAAAGLAAIVASSAAAFTVVKYAGAAYLIFLGLRALLAAAPSEGPAAPASASPKRLYWEGFAVGALNPKLALFLLAFLPQFIDPAGTVWLQTLVLGLTFNLVAALGDTLFALASGTAGERIRRAISGRGIERASGVVYLGLGAAAALAGPRTKP